MSLKVLQLFRAIINKVGIFVNEDSSSTVLSTVDGAREIRFAFTVSPAVEKTRSDGVLEW